MIVVLSIGDADVVGRRCDDDVDGPRRQVGGDPDTAVLRIQYDRAAVVKPDGRERRRSRGRYRAVGAGAVARVAGRPISCRASASAFAGSFP